MSKYSRLHFMAISFNLLIYCIVNRLYVMDEVRDSTVHWPSCIQGVSRRPKTGQFQRQGQRFLSAGPHQVLDGVSHQAGFVGMSHDMSCALLLAMSCHSTDTTGSWSGVAAKSAMLSTTTAVSRRRSSQCPSSWTCGQPWTPCRL